MALQQQKKQQKEEGGGGEQKAPMEIPKEMSADLSKVADKLQGTQPVEDALKPEKMTVAPPGPGAEDGGKSGEEGTPAPTPVEQKGEEGEAVEPEAEGKEEEGADAEDGELDTSDVESIGQQVGADLSNTNVVVDDARTGAAGASGMTDDPSEIVLNSSAVKDGKPDKETVAHEAVHVAQMQKSGGASGGKADLESEAKAGASAVSAGGSFAPAMSASSGQMQLNPTGESAAEEKVQIPATQNLTFYGQTITVNTPQSKRKVAKDKASTLNISGAASQPEWMRMSNVKLQFKGNELKEGSAKFRFTAKELNKDVSISPVGGGSSRVAVTIDSGGNLKVGDSLPSVRLSLKGLGQIEFSDIGFDSGGLKYDATLSSAELQKLAERTIGGKLTKAEVKASRAGGKFTLGGDGTFDVAKGGKKVLEGEFKLNSRGTNIEGEAKAKFPTNMKVLSSVEVKGKYTVEKGWDMAVTLGKDLFKGAGDKLSLQGQVELSYTSEKGVNFAGGLGANLKLSDKLGFEGSAVVGFLSEFNQSLGAQLSLKGDFKPNKNIEVSGKIEGFYNFEDGQIKATGEPSVKFLKHYTVKVPVEYDSKGAPKWKVSPTIEIDNFKIPGLDKPFEKKFEPTLPRFNVPLFGPLVLEGGPTFRLEAGLGPARVDKAKLVAQIDIDKGFEFKKADLKGKLVCPFYAEAAVGFMFGLGVNVVLASGGAGFEFAIRAGLGKGSNRGEGGEGKNAVTADLNASLLGGAGGKGGFSFDAGVDVSANLELVGDANVYARYDTIFTREKIYRHTLGSLKLMSYGPIGANGKLSYSQGKGFDWNGEWKTPEFKAPGPDWVRSKFDAIRDWF